ncbi:response regulator transcription factor [Paraburkholderia sp. BR10937]|uniref:response regulator transcription factor n=1 Tax=Paraburkholderia sp. BR10937 TaxID=3236994 RepID=UPI0034D2A6C9
MRNSLEPGAIVYVVDDDPGICSGLESLFRSEGLEVRTFNSPHTFLNSEIPDVVSCLILDVRLRGMSGLTIQQNALQAGIHMPVIFLTAYGDIAMTVQAMKAGAFDFLTKPCREQDILDAVAGALRRSEETRSQDYQALRIRSLYAMLTPREREVIFLVAEGLRNKQIADRVGLSEVTVKIHRAQAMRKLSARSVAELVKMLQHVPAVSS